MRLLFHAVIIIHIHLQLADILMRQFVRLDFDNNEALQQAVIENKIGKEVITIEMQALLPRDKGKTVAEFQQKILQMADNRAFQIFFVIGRLAL